jgi:hypothetical protein
MGARWEGDRLRGDSKTTQKWSREEKVKGTEAINAARVMSAICVRFETEVNDTEIVTEKQNWKADDLSRRI